MRGGIVMTSGWQGVQPGTNEVVAVDIAHRRSGWWINDRYRLEIKWSTAHLNLQGLFCMVFNDTRAPTE